MGNALAAKVNPVQAIKSRDVTSLVQSMQPQLERALGRAVNPDRWCRLLLTEIRISEQNKQKEIAKNPNASRWAKSLLDCNPYSLLGAMLHCAALELYPGPRQHVHFVPYGDECQIIVGYRGFMELARRSGEIKHLHTALVYSCDEFEWNEALLDHPCEVHRPPRVRPDDAELQVVWGYARATDGTAGWFERMDQTDIDRIKGALLAKWQAKVRKRRKRWDGDDDPGNWPSPWNEHEGEMWRKTLVRRMAKYLPLGTSDAIAQAESIDGQTVLPWTPGTKPETVAEADVVDDSAPQSLPERSETPAEPVTPGAEGMTEEEMAEALRLEREQAEAIE